MTGLKAKLNEHQIKAIEAIKKNNFYKNKLDIAVKDHIESPLRWGNDALHASGMPIDTFIRALYVGYDEIPKVGEWFVTNCGCVGQVESVNEKEGLVSLGDIEETKNRGICISNSFKIADIARKAQPEEISRYKEERMWKLLNRSFREFKLGDVFVYEGDDHVLVYCPETAMKEYMEGNVIGFLPRDEYYSFEIFSLGGEQ